jgi:cobyrinic acid a,c-diamide synthase
MTLVIAGERSGVGKTTVTLALLADLSRRSAKIQSFKVGPDYIDPMFHQYVMGRPCRNLDPVLTSEAYVQKCFTDHSQVADYALVEGVMGLFDGATGQNDWGSTAHIARLLNLPVLLVLDCSRLSRSIAAIAHGYQSFDPRVKIAGLVLNRVGSDRHLELLKTALEPLHLPILGILRRQDNITIPDRHLGLVPTAELPNLRSLVDHLAHIGETCFDWSQLLPLLAGSQPAQAGQTQLTKAADPTSMPEPSSLQTHLRIAIAQDRAFSFYYPDNLDLLRQLGAELVPWSPLSDPALPDGVQGLYLGGGFPELFAQTLAENTSACHAVRAAIQAGMPTYAECGGLMYLSKHLSDFNGASFPMVGILPATVVMAPRLTLGYRQAIALQNGPLLPAGTKVWGHEFHRSRLTTEPQTPLFRTQGYDVTTTKKGAVEGWRLSQLHASYIHLHWGDRSEIPQRFLRYCANWQRTKAL